MIIRNDTWGSIIRKNQADNRRLTTVDSRQQPNLRYIPNKKMVTGVKSVILKTLTTIQKPK